MKIAVLLIVAASLFAAALPANARSRGHMHRSMHSTGGKMAAHRNF